MRPTNFLPFLAAALCASAATLPTPFMEKAPSVEKRISPHGEKGADQSCGNGGLQQYRYTIRDKQLGSNFSEGFGDLYSNLGPADLDLAAKSRRVVTTIDTLSMPGYLLNGALMYTGYLFIPHEADYIFNVTDVDDLVAFWIDEHAKTGFNKDNVDKKVSWQSLGLHNNRNSYLGTPPGPANGIFVKHFAPGYHPIRVLYAQFNAQQELEMTLKLAGGKITLFQSQQDSLYLVTAPCYDRQFGFQ